MFDILTILLLFSIFLGIIRFLIGPSTKDRVVAFDAIGIIGVSLLILLAIIYQRVIYLDIALVFGLIGFLGTTIFGRYIEKGI